jgi:hypothetical protein
MPAVFYCLKNISKQDMYYYNYDFSVETWKLFFFFHRKWKTLKLLVDLIFAISILNIRLSHKAKQAVSYVSLFFKRNETARPHVSYQILSNFVLHKESRLL